MRKPITIVLLAILLLLTFAAPALAQVDVTDEPAPTVAPTAEVTPLPEPTPAPEEPAPAPPFTGVQIGELLLLLGLSFLGGGGVLAIVFRFLERKDVRDRIEDARNSWSEEQKQFLREFTDGLKTANTKLLDFLESIQDGKENA